VSDELRAPRPEDAPAVARLMSRARPEPTDPRSVLRDWTFPGVQLEQDARLGHGSYAAVENFGNERVWIEIAGRPGQELLDWAESRARELGSRLLSGGWATQEPLLRELERREFQLVRRSFRMTIDVGEATTDPVWPSGVQPRGFEPGDEQTLYELYQETFRDSWEPIEETYEEWAHQFLAPEAFTPALWTLAVAGDEPAGFAICHPHPARGELGWVHVLGVRSSYRGRGVGRAILLRSFREFRRHGLTGAGLGVDSESPTGANKLYESVGMRVSAQFAIYEKGAS